MPGVPAKKIDAEATRAAFGVEEAGPGILSTFSIGGAPKVTQTRSVTTTGDDDEVLKDHIRNRGRDLIDRLLALALDEDVKHNISLQAIGMLLDRGFGKPTQRSETTQTHADLSSLHLDEIRRLSK